jgi:hypothetical protein
MAFTQDTLSKINDEYQMYLGYLLIIKFMYDRCQVTFESKRALTSHGKAYTKS